MKRKNSLMSPGLISGDMNIGTVVEKYPRVAAIFTGYGLHCTGCHGSNSETIEAGAAGHGMDEETIALMLRDANKIALADAEDTKNDSELKITSKAAQNVTEFIKQSKKKGGYLRISIIDGGCSGKSYNFALENNRKNKDTIIEKNGAKFILDKSSYEQLKGSKIDYLESLQGSGFKIHNPNANHTCGCGSSFS